jgi:hypothetical protein
MLSFKQFTFPPQGQYTNLPFEPSVPTKKFWLYTKKNEINYGITLPGLFETTGYSTQMLAFFGILLLEIIPTVYGINQGLLWEAVAAAILVDIILAVVSHLWHYDMLLARNQLVISNNPIDIQNLKNSIKKYKFITNIFYFLIFISGCVKAAFFYIAYLEIDAISGAVIICYLLGSVLHITYTGYFLFTSRFYWFINQEFKVYLKTNGGKYSASNINIQPITTDGAQVKLNVSAQGLHNISMDQNGNFYFETLSVLTDRELTGFINAQQNSIARGVIAREGLSQQLLQIGAIQMGAANIQQQPILQNNAPVVNNQNNL